MHKVDVFLGCLDAGLRFFLKGVQHVDHTSEAYRVDRAKSITAKILHNFQYT